MKKLFLLFATVTLLVGVQACKQKDAATDTSTTVTTDSTSVTKTVPSDSVSVAAEKTDTGGKDIKIPPPTK